MREKLAEFEEEEAVDIKYKLRHFTKFKVLLVVTSILAVLSITFIVLYAVEKSIDNDSANEQGKTPRTAARKYVLTQHSVSPIPIWKNVSFKLIFLISSRSFHIY